MRQPDIVPLKNAGLFFGKPLYRLRETWTFEVETDYGTFSFCIPASYQFDAASVPRLFWGFPFGYTPDGVHRAAALEHDFLCDLGLKQHKFMEWYALKVQGNIPKALPPPDVHRHFFNKLKKYGLRPSQAFVMGTAVRLFGPKW